MPFLKHPAISVKCNRKEREGEISFVNYSAPLYDSAQKRPYSRVTIKEIQNAPTGRKGGNMDKKKWLDRLRRLWETWLRRVKGIRLPLRPAVRLHLSKESLLRLLIIAGSSLTALAAATLGAYFLWEKPPELAAGNPVLTEIARTQESAAPTDAPTPTPDRGTAFETERQDGVYTLLLAGSDDGTGNTDTIMVAKLDTVRHTANFVSIPRDTLINVDTPIRKLNGVYWTAVYSGASGSEALRRHVKKLTGFDVDCYAVISLEGFERAVDALGGIWYDVPKRMYYEDGPVIDLWPGFQLLNGEQAMWLCRYRSGYVNGDLDRIKVQHDFLKAAANQFLGLGSIPNIPEVAAILAESMDTNMTAANMAWFARQFLRCRGEDVHFYTAPNTPAYVHDLSYTFLDLYNWIDMVNDCLNPGTRPVSEGMLDLVYLRGGEVCCTTALKGISYFSLGRREETPAEEPEEMIEEVTVEPEEEAPLAPGSWIDGADGGETSPAPYDIPTDDDWLTEL